MPPPDNLIDLARLLRRRIMRARRRVYSGEASKPQVASDFAFNWHLRTAAQFDLAASGGGGDVELVLNGAANFAALRGDKADKFTTDGGGKVTGWSSAISGGWPANNFSFGTDGTRDAGGWVKLSSAGDTDANADYFQISALGTRYQSQQSDTDGENNRHGIVYMLARIRTVPDYVGYLFRLGANDGAWKFGSYRAYVLGVYGGQLRGLRGDANSSTYVDLGACPANEWVALGFVINDDRASAGGSENKSRIYAKTKAGGSFGTMAFGSTDAKQVIHHGSFRAYVNRGLYNGGTSVGSMAVDVGAFYFDPVPPVGAGADALIESNLDILLARVA